MSEIRAYYPNLYEIVFEFYVTKGISLVPTKTNPVKLQVCNLLEKVKKGISILMDNENTQSFNICQ